MWARGTCLAVYDANDVYIGGSTYDNTTNKWNLLFLKIIQAPLVGVGLIQIAT